jgi:hypothetical protein
LPSGNSYGTFYGNPWNRFPIRVNGVGSEDLASVRRRLLGVEAVFTKMYYKQIFQLFPIRELAPLIGGARTAETMGAGQSL